LPSTPSALEQTNRSIRYGNSLILKTYRRIEDGVHPELELGRFLTEDRRLACVAPLAGAVEYRRRRSESAVVAVLHGYVPNEGDALQYSLDVLSVFFERVATMPALAPPPPAPLRRRLGEDGMPPPPQFAAELLHGYLEMVRLLGKRLGELHRTLASAPERPDFAPEPISLQYQRAIYQSLRNVLFDVLHDLESEAGRLPPGLAEMARQVRHLQGAILGEIHAILGRRINATRIRCHGDCHLHQVLFTGKDFLFIDFEGRPAQSIGERRIKRSPLVDVVSMIRSFDYAAHAALFGLASGRGRTTGAIRHEDRPALFPWARAWRVWTHNAFVQGYLEICADASFVPDDEQQRNILFRVLLLDKLLSELAKELRTRSDWLEIPLTGILEVIQAPPDA